MKITEEALGAYPELLDFIHTKQNITEPQLATEYKVPCENGNAGSYYVLTPIEIIARMGLLEHLKILLYPSTRSNLSISSIYSFFTKQDTKQATSSYTTFERALFKAIDGGHLDIVQYLLEKPDIIASLHKSGESGEYAQSLLINAVKADVPSMKILTALLNIPCIADTVNMDNNSVLIKAMEKGLPEQINHLLTLPRISSNLASGKNKILRTAIYHNQTDFVNQLLDNPAVISIIAAKDNRVLKIAAFAGNLECINRLLEYEEVYNNANSEGNAALQMAAVGGHVEVVKRLLEIPHVADNIACANNIVFRHVVYNRPMRGKPILDKASQKDMIKLLLTYKPVAVTYNPVAERAGHEIRTSIASYRRSLLLNKKPPTQTMWHSSKTPMTITIPSEEQIKQFLSGHELEEAMMDSIYQLIAYHSYSTIDRTRCEDNTDTSGLCCPVGAASGEPLPYWGKDYNIINGIACDDNDKPIDSTITLHSAPEF